MAVKVKLLQKKISGGRKTLYLDFYPAIISLKTGKETRREFLGLYIHEKPKNAIEKQYNAEQLKLAEAIRQQKENTHNKPEIYNREVLEMRNDLDDLLKDYYSNELLDQDMDFYYPRSYFIAESIIKSAPRDVLKQVMNKVIDRVPTVQIYNYNTFKKHAFDKSIVSKAFPDWKEGKEFYERAFLYDFKNPYVLQQGALYLSMKKKYHDAFSWIDRAITMTNNKHFSIRNSHAIILFDANYNVDSTDAERQLDASMDILSQCINSDLRTTFHAKTYADQAVRYYNKYGNDRAVSYLNQAKLWLEKEIQERGWDYDVRKQLVKIDDILKRI